MNQINETLTSLPARQEATLKVLDSLERFVWKYRFKSLWEQVGMTSKNLDKDISATCQARTHEQKSPR